MVADINKILSEFQFENVLKNRLSSFCTHDLRVLLSSVIIDFPFNPPKNDRVSCPISEISVDWLTFWVKSASGTTDGILTRVKIVSVWDSADLNGWLNFDSVLTLTALVKSVSEVRQLESQSVRKQCQDSQKWLYSLFASLGQSLEISVSWRKFKIRWQNLIKIAEGRKFIWKRGKWTRVPSS